MPTENIIAPFELAEAASECSIYRREMDRIQCAMEAAEVPEEFRYRITEAFTTGWMACHNHFAQRGKCCVQERKTGRSK